MPGKRAKSIYLGEGKITLSVSSGGKLVYDNEQVSSAYEDVIDESGRVSKDVKSRGKRALIIVFDDVVKKEIE